MTQPTLGAAATLDEWKQKCSAVSSRDPLVPAIAEGIDALATLLSPDSRSSDFDRALRSFDFARENSMRFDQRRDVPMRNLTYGLMEGLHRSLHEMHGNNWQPAWMKKVKSEPSSETRVVQREEPVKSAPALDSPKKVKVEEPEEDEERPARAEIDRLPNRSGNRRGPDFYVARQPVGSDDGSEDAPRTARRRACQRAKSFPTARAVKKETPQREVKKRRPMGKRGAFGCTLCDWHGGNSPSTVIAHLRNQHGQTTTTAGIYFRCKCGFESRSNNHKCKDTAFSIVKDEDKEFTPKRLYVNNLRRRVRAKKNQGKMEEELSDVKKEELSDVKKEEMEDVKKEEMEDVKKEEMEDVKKEEEMAKELSDVKKEEM